VLTCDDFGDCGSQRISVIQHNDSSDWQAGTANVVFTYNPASSAQVGDIAAAAALAPPETTDIAICTAPTYTGLPVAVAGDTGIFESFGFTSWEYVSCPSGPANAAALVAGEVQFVANTPDNMLGLRDSGFDVVMFGSGIDGHFFDILVATGVETVPGDWEATMQALDGLTVGVVARGAAAEQLARELYEQAGVDPDNAAYVATGLGGTTVAALDAGEIDWAITFEPGMTMGVVEGIGTRPFSLVAGDGPSTLDWPSLVNTTSREFAEANPNTVAAYQAALDAASAWIKDDANINGVLEVMAARVGLVGANMAADVHANNKQYFSTDGSLDPNRIMNNVAYAVGRGIISGPMDFESFAIGDHGVPEALVRQTSLDGVDLTMCRANWASRYIQAEMVRQILEQAGATVSEPSEIELGPSNAYIAMAEDSCDLWANSWYPGHFSWFEN
ncbi:MAG: ABC transporter substrate-binding protein, partial [Acidobacteria bacterium]|nr:ABC transporter substrate-binding protein [Acidobacteriota bacterium]